jgi:hypothetical protein
MMSHDAVWLGVGGTGAAMKHYVDTGRHYPLVVKLGTITASGADVYSYAEDENTEVGRREGCGFCMRHRVIRCAPLVCSTESFWCTISAFTLWSVKAGAV